MAAEIFVRWRKELLEDVEFLGKVLFNKSKANMELYLLSLAVAVEFQCPTSEGTPSATGPRTGQKDPIYASLTSAVALHHFGAAALSDITEDDFRVVLENYANGGITKLSELLADSQDPLGTLIEILSSRAENSENA